MSDASHILEAVALLRRDNAEPVCLTPCEVSREAFYLPGQSGSLFTWLHQPSSGGSGHGFIICPPVGHEYVHSHRTLRHLADRLAAQGYAVLRLDYHGVGDSAGTDLDPQRLATWQANVSDALQWMRQQGCTQVSLLGLRLGATLALLAAEQQEVEQLILWEPVVKGRRYARELSALGLTAKQAGDSTDGVEAVGFVYTPETLQSLGRLDLTQAKPRCRRALIVRNDKGPTDTSLLDQLQAQGVKTELLAVPGYDEMMAEPQFTCLPETAMQAVTAWTGLAPRAAVAMPVISKAACPDLKESVHRISACPDLFGIITEPEKTTDLPWIVMLNSGAAHRIGPGRLHVKLARHLASLGYPCLRLDLSGLGDSTVDAGREENDTYPATAFRDIECACDYLQRFQPGRRIVLMGLCSGAYAAFQSAVQLPHPAIVEGILLNPLTFFWREGMSLTMPATQQLQTWHYYKRILLDLNNWKQLFSSKSSNGGLKGAVQRFMQRMFPKKEAPSPAAASPSKAPDNLPYGHPVKEDLKADLQRVIEGSRQLTMIVSETDPGHFLLMYKARRKANQLLRRKRLSCYFISNADHTFSTESAREKLVRQLSEHLNTRYAGT